MRTGNRFIKRGGVERGHRYTAGNQIDINGSAGPS
jgi:hypothetical protein